MRTVKAGLVLGAAGGVAATIVIDVVTAGVMPLMGLPPTAGFATIGDTAAGFFALLGLQVAGGVLPGAILHYLIGLVLGAVFGAAAAGVSAFRLTSLKRGISLGILYTELISLPILVTPPLILNWGLADAAQWFGFSVVMHAIWGAVLGAVVAYGLGPAGRQHLRKPPPAHRPHSTV
jgi:hypothetical protein